MGKEVYKSEGYGLNEDQDGKTTYKNEVLKEVFITIFLMFSIMFIIKRKLFWLLNNFSDE